MTQNQNYGLGGTGSYKSNGGAGGCHCHSEQKCCKGCLPTEMLDLNDNDSNTYMTIKNPTCINDSCPCHTEQKGWRELFRKDFPPEEIEDGYSPVIIADPSVLISFIERTLQKQREEMVERVEGLKKEIPTEGEAALMMQQGSIAVEAVRFHAHNMAIIQCLALIKDKI